MRKIHGILLVPVLFIMSCQKGTSCHDTAILTERTLKIIDYFLDETKEWEEINQLVLVGNFENKECSHLIIYSNDTSLYKPHGKYNGMVYYRECEILLFGDSWNDFFWSSDMAYIVENMNSEERNNVFYDPISWEICLCLNDTSINIDCSNFPDIFSEHTRSLIDSIEIILRH